jgi:hypothetical protein
MKDGAFQSLSLSTHSRMYAGQFSSFMPSASQLLRNLTASRSASLRSPKSRMVIRWSRSKSFFSSSTCSASMRPLKANTVNPCRADLSILNVIGCRRDALHCRLRPLTQVEVQSRGHLQAIENKRLAA